MPARLGSLIARVWGCYRVDRLEEHTEAVTTGIETQARWAFVQLCDRVPVVPLAMDCCFAIQKAL